MTIASERISLRLEGDELQSLDQLVDSGGYRSRSEAVRDAIEMLLAYKTQGLNHRIAQLRVPLSLLERIDSLVDTGELLDRETGFLELLRAGVKGMEDEWVHREERLSQRRSQAVARRKEREGADEQVRP